MSPRAALLALLLFSIVSTHAHSALAHGDVMRIGSTQPGGGQIVIEPEFVFATDEFYIPPIGQVGDIVLYSDIFPSFSWILEAANGFHPLTEEVEVDFTIAAPLSEGASVRLDNRIIDAPGETSSVGPFVNDPEDHVHPEWRLRLPTGVIGDYVISFRLSADGFSDSPVYTLLVTNEVPPATPTPTATIEVTVAPTVEATSTATATSEPVATDTPEATPTGEPVATDTPGSTATSTATQTATATRTHTFPAPACPGDCDGNGTVSIAELIRAVGLATGGGTEGCVAADANGDGAIVISELIRAVRSALDGCDG